MKDPVVLKVYRGTRLIAVKQFLSSQIVIGRQSDAGLSLDDEQVSPLHAVIEEKEEGTYVVSDLGSESGIKLEGATVLESEIESGQAILIGPYSIRFYIGVPKPPPKVDFNAVHHPPGNKGASDSDQVDINAMQKQRGAKKKASSPPPPPTEEKHIPFNDEHDDVTDPGVYVEKNEKTSPGFSNAPISLYEDQDQDKIQPQEPEPAEIEIEHEDDVQVEVQDESGVKIQDRDVQEALNAQKSEPLSSGYVAPKSAYSKVDEIIYPYSRGSVLEVVVAWQERVIRTYHFTNTQKIYLSNHQDGDVYTPLPGPKFRHLLINFTSQCTVNIASTMTGDLYYNNKSESLAKLAEHSSVIRSVGNGSQLKLEQGQMLKLNLLSDRVSAYIRFVEDAPLVSRAPIFDFGAAEVVGIFMSFASVFVIGLYMLFYVPSTLGETEDLLEDRLKKAVITFTPPPKIETPPPPPEIVKPPPPPIPVEQPKKPRVVKVAEKKATPKPVKAQTQAGKKANIPDKKPGKPKEAAPSRVKTANNAGSSRPGGSVNTGKEASSMKTEQKDLTKTGILGVLSGGGANTSLDKASSGVGSTIGLADQKTGFQGQASDQAGEGLGTKLQEAGKGGSGTSLAGVGDLNTAGRGGGSSEYGAGGLGGKGTSTIIGVDGLGEEFSSTIDKDAIRRLIRKNRNALAGCYERALDINSSVSGKVVLNWKITNGGKMIEPKVKSSTLNNPTVEQCIISRLMVLKFPDPGPNEIAEVDYPFVFKPSN